MTVKVRFAPSPTGFLHIGGARTALFNWAYARSRGGKFVLRIEDTDTQRSKKEFVDEILFSMKWLGLDWDEGPYFQSQRYQIYRDFAEKLVSKGVAYRAKERRNKGLAYKKTKNQTELEQLDDNQNKGEAIIFSVPEKEVEFVDLIRGPIKIDARQFGDIVLIKSDGSPAYNFACVVDDALMGITHVLRGDDHISNTPKQILLYEALGFDVPRFAHFPLILGRDGARLSKRTGATAVSQYREMGYLNQALVNYLMLLGWSLGDDREIFPIDEAIKLFDIKDVNKTAAVFDINKLNWVNSQYIKQKPSQELLELLQEFFEKRGIKPDKNYALKVIDLFKERATVLTDFVDWADYFWKDDYSFDKQAVEMFLSEDRSGWFEELVKVFVQIDNWNPEIIETQFRELVKRLGIKARELIHPVRVAVSGKRIGPSLFELLWVLGKDKVINRLKRAIDIWRNKKDFPCA